MEDVIIVSSEVNKQTGNPILTENVNGGRPKRLLLDSPKELKCQVDLGTGNTKCCVLNCSTNYLTSEDKSQITFITFPRDPSRFTEWMRAIGRSDLSSYMGKKEATNLLVCSRHFSNHMWVNSNTRLKRLHKNAVPEMMADDDINIISIGSASDSPLSARKSGLKVKKVTSLLSESALRDSLSGSDSSLTEVPEILIDSPPTMKGRKFPTVLHRPKPLPANSTEMEKKLYSENAKLKSELDKNMDYILNQKAHYEGILSKEKQKVAEFADKVKVLESAQRKLWHTYEAQLQAQKTVASSKDVGHKELIIKLKLLEKSNEEFERNLAKEKETVKNLRAANNDLVSVVEQMSVREESPEPPRTPPPTKLNFTGEKFKDFLDFHLLKEKHLEEKIEDLKVFVDQAVTKEGQKSKLLNLAAENLNHLHLAWLKWILNMKENRQEDFEDRLKEFALSIFETSESAYVLCAKAFGLPSPDIVKGWRSDSASLKATSSSTISALYEEGESFPRRDLIKTNVDLENELEELEDLKGRKMKRRRGSRLDVAEKRFKDDDECEEGRVSDEDEEIFFTDSEDEDEEDEDEEEEEEEDKTNMVLYSPKGRISSRKVDNFNFIMDEEDDEEEEVPSLRSSSHGLGKSMPILESESPIIASSSNTIDPKISNRKKVISSDSSLRGGSKVVFRVIES